MLPALLLEEHYQEAAEIFEAYDEPTANMAYNRAYLAFVTNGWTERTKELLQKAAELNPYVPEYLLGQRKLPKMKPAYVGMGDENEAIDYAQGHFDLWQMKKELLNRLKETIERR